MAHIFISYSRSDEVFARQLATSLSELGADVWIDIEDIPVGMKWSRAIQDGLDVSDVLLVVISPQSMASQNVEDEWQYYLDQKKPVIPILLAPAKLHFQLSRIQYIDFNRNPYPKALRQLHTELGRKGVKLNPLPRGNTSTQPVVRLQPTYPAVSTQPQPERRLPIMWLAVGAVLLIVGIGLGVFLSNPNRTADATTQPPNQPTTRIIPTSRPDDDPSQQQLQQRQLPTTDPYSQSQSQTGTIRYDDGDIRFDYPSGWLLKPVYDQQRSLIITANNQTTLDGWAAGEFAAIDSIQSGQIGVAILPQAEILIPDIYGMSLPDAVSSLQQQMLQSYSISFGDISHTEIENGEVAYVVGADTNNHTVEIMVVNTKSGDSTYILILGAAASDQAVPFVNGLNIIANSLHD